MSTSNVPKISVTAEKHRHSDYEHHSTTASSDSDENSSNDKDYLQSIGGLTDIEDFDSCADADRPRSRKSSRSSLVVANGLPHTQGDITDVEDFNDSEADEDDEKSTGMPDLKVSLHEFLHNDLQENYSLTNGCKQTMEYLPGNFLQAQNLNSLNDYLTDCEDFNTDSELENNCEKSVCINLSETFGEHVNITDLTLKAKNFEDDNDNTSVVSDLSCAASGLFDVGEKVSQVMSEDEMLELSSNEESYQISCSDSDSVSNDAHISEEYLLSEASMPPLDVTFIHPVKRRSLCSDIFVQSTDSKGTLRKNMFLEVEGKRKGEVFTDTERFDDSVAESCDEDSFDGDDGNQLPIPQAVVMAIGDEGGCVTDCEDVFCDDMSDAASSAGALPFSVDLSVIPLPQREVILLQEDTFGDTTASVMPMDKEYVFGIHENKSDECLTDTEEYTCSEDMNLHLLSQNIPSRSPSPSPQNILHESDITVANESLKTQQSKRAEILSNAESVTDVEEIYMAGTSIRKKKLKSRPVTKTKSKFLEAPRSHTEENASGTDVEDIELSDTGVLTPQKCAKKRSTNRQANQSYSEKCTDIEDITADDMSSASETELPVVDMNFVNLKEYDTSGKNIVVTLETCTPMSTTKHHSHKKSKSTDFFAESSLVPNQNLHQQQYTDVEDVQLPSDAEKAINTNVAVIDCICQELTDMLSASCTTVHDKCINSFNIDSEKLHIKGMLRETHTDIEYVESDESAARGSK